MADNVIKVSVSTGKPTRVSVSAPENTQGVNVTRDTSAYNAELAKQWAVGEGKILNQDYSSRYYASKAQASADVSKVYASASESVYQNVQETANNAIANIKTARVEAVDNITTVKSESIASVEAKGNEVLSTVNAGITEINNTKTTIINDIEFVADGEKKEIEDLIDNGKEELKESIGDVKVLTTLEIGDIGFTQMAIDETKGKRRILNGQLIIQEQYIEFTKIVKDSVALNADLACTEEEWQTAVTMSEAGICYKYVIDDEAGTIRLPKYPNHFIAGLDAIAPVVGTGQALGLRTSTAQGAMMYKATDPRHFGPSLYEYLGAPLGTTASSNNWVADKVVGVVDDPAKSGIEAHINQEQIKGAYFIQVATGAETEDNIVNEIELNNPFSLLDYKYSEYELNNLSWLRSEGQYNSKAVYPAVYDLLLKIYNSTETKAGVSVKLSTETFTDYDFVLDTAEETFRLPILVGNEVLPDYSQAVSQEFGVEYTAERNGFVFARRYCTSTSSSEFATITVNGRVFSFNYYNNSAGADCSAILVPIKKGDVYTVSNKASKQYVYFIPAINSGNLYFYVGETVQNANLINAGRIEEVVAECITRMDCKAYITETYQNGSSWYRVYSDGWCEQGGVFVNTGTVTFLKPFTNADYTVLVNYIESTSSDQVPLKMVSPRRTATGFTVESSTIKKAWFAFGYKA